MDDLRRFGCTGIGVYTHPTEVMPQARLEKSAARRIKRLSETAQDCGHKWPDTRLDTRRAFAPAPGVCTGEAGWLTAGALALQRG